MTSLGDASPTDSLTPDQIMKQYPTAINQIIAAAVDQQYDFERVLAVNKCRRNWQMVIGNHFLVPGLVNTPYGEIADYLLLDAPASYPEGGAQQKFSYAFNFVGGDLYKFCAVMGNSAPRVKAVADDPTDEVDIQAAHDADAMIRDLWIKWGADELQRVLAFHQYTTGPCYMRTPWVRDARKYGQTVEPNISTSNIPTDDGSQLPVPQMGQPTTYVNGDVELRIYSILEVAHPWMAKCLDDCYFLKCEEYRSKWALLDAFKSDDPTQPGILEQYRTTEPPDEDVSASTTSATEARESVTVPSGLGRPKKPDFWRFTEWWAQPLLFQAIEDPLARRIFQQHFPDGLYVARVGNVNVSIDNRNVCGDWAVCKTGRGERILERPIIDDCIPMQRAINDTYNMMIETALRAISQTIVDAALLSRDALANKEAVPAEIILAPLPPDGDISKRIFQIPPVRVSDQLVPISTLFRAGMQEISGIRPELTGGGQTTQTYREAKQRKDQALMQLSPQAAAEQAAWTDAATNAVKMRAKFGTGQVKSPRKSTFGTEVDVVELAALKDTGWHVEGDDSFPMSAADRFDKLWGLLKEFPPEVQQALSILDPVNLEETLEILQIPGYESVPEDQKRKTMSDIMQLMQGQPTPAPDGSMQPSIPIDDYDDHQFISTFLPNWMKSKTGQTQKQTNPTGFQNVEAFWNAHKQAANPPPPPPPPPVRANLGFTAKLEDFPNLIPEVMQGAGLPAPPPGAEQPVPPPPAPDQAAAGGAPQAPAGQQTPAPPESNLPPIDGLPAGPQGPTIQ